MYALCSGRPPFRAETTYGILRRVTDDAPRSLRELNPELPEWLDVLILKLLTKSAVDRLQTAEHVAELLEQCLAHLQQPDSSPLPEHLRSSSSRRTALPFRRAGLLVTLAVVALLITAGTMLKNSPPSNDVASQDTTESSVVTAETSTTVSAKPSAENALLPPSPLQWDDGLERQLEELNSEIEVLFENTDAPK